jgi:hypothetical protein
MNMAHDPPDTDDVGVRVLRVELSVGAAFAQIGQETDDLEKRKRYRAHAQAAFDAVLRFSTKVPLTPEESTEISDGLNALRSAIAAIQD